ncbi:hypothetical protein BA895_08280 [Humibacillus sp. DSM 29435]|nr:hypothetical protein BA895_08280 [Humibacillus sp. DSM 29435]
MRSVTDRPASSLTDGTEAIDETLDIVRLLWPPPHQVTTAGPSLRQRGFAVLPNAVRPTRLVPDNRSGSTADALSGAAGKAGLMGQLRRKALTGGVRAGLLRFTPTGVAIAEEAGAPSLIARLSAIFDETLTTSIHLGPPRANRKPVLNVVNAAGRTVAFVKVGINPLTRSLVCAEGKALTRIGAAPLRAVQVPQVLHEETWGDLRILCLSPLDTSTSRPAPLTLVQQAMVEISEALGTDSVAVGDSDHLQGLRSNAAALSSPQGRLLVGALDRLRESFGHLSVATGAWHGDWTPWNMSWSGDVVNVWDWERLQRGVPLGMDALHLQIQRSLRVPGSDAARVTAEHVGRRQEILAPWGHDAVTSTITTLVYLLTLGCRYAVDGQEEAGARLGRLDDWLFPVVDQLLHERGPGRER